MSIYFDFDVGPTGRRFRRAVDSDRSDIELFWNRKHTELLFGDVDLGALIELSTLAICMINKDMKVMGFMALCDHPNVAGVEPSDWEMWVRNLYQRFYLSRNTLFIHFMCCIDDVADYFLEEAFVSVFLNDCYLCNIVLVMPFSICDDEVTRRFQTFRKRNISKYLPRTDDKSGSCLYTATRQEFCPKLKMRRAVEEDNDDIVEILRNKCPRLHEMYGEYYISEIIGRYPESKRKIIVADCGGRAVGVMGLNTDINYKKLQKLYELRPYYGLRRATALEKEQARRANRLLTTYGEPIIQGKWTPFDNLSKFESVIDDEERKEIENCKTKKASKVSFKRNAAMRRSLDHIMYKKQDSDDFSDKVYMQSPTQSTATACSVINLLDEEPFDYEIVNIDSTLLTVPEAMSHDLLFRPSLNNSKQCGLNINKKRTKKRKSLHGKTATKEDVEPIIYRGGQNAFIIELYGLRDDIDERYGFDLLEAAFEITKDYDYCAIRVPSEQKAFPLLQHFTFVPTRPKVCSKYALYLAHRSSVLGKLRVREAEFVDIPHVARLMQNLEGKETIWTVENSIQNNKHNRSYVFVSGLSLVGLGILEPPEQIEFIQGRFNLDSYHIHKYYHRGHGVDAGFATLKAVLVYPVFEPHFRFFVREMMRLSGSNALMWLTAYRNKWAVHKSNCVVTAMIPLVPRPFTIDSAAVPDLKKISILAKSIMSFSTWFISKKITSIPKANVNARIVILGASRTALGFLNSLLFSHTSTYLTFTDVTLISPNGLPYMRHSKPLAELMFPRNYNSSDKYMKSVPYTYYINVVQGTMMEIDQQEKCIFLTSGNKFYYDYLFLFFGKQYQHPNYMSDFLKKQSDYYQGRIPKYIPLDVPRLSESDSYMTSDEIPDNVFIVNNITQANKALDYVRQLLWKNSFTVVVYGATLNAYCCVHALLEMKVPPESIVLVEPFPPENPSKLRVPVFCNSYVDQTVRKVLANLNIKVYRSYYFQSWTLNSDAEVSHVEFLSQFQLLQQECSAFFYYGKRGMDMQAFVAINKSSLIYDGGVVIDLECRTSDPSIYAAGTATSYHKKYFVPTHTHKYYDTYEVGEKLGARIRNQLDPLFTQKIASRSKPDETSHTSNSSTSKTSTNGETTSNRSDASSIDEYSNMELLRLKKPKVMYCTLPGGLKYLEVRAPGFKIPHYYVQSLQYNGLVMETFKGGYFKLHLTRDLVVDGVTCLSPDNFSLENFKHLYGKPATVLNNVHLKYTGKKLDNFYEFFRAPWAFFLYHDHADDLFAMVKELLPKNHPRGRILREAISEFGNNLTNPVSRLNTKMNLRAKFEKSAHVDAITDYVMEWLSQNDVLLPMYLQPSQKVHFVLDPDSGPVFQKRRNTITRMMSMIL